MKQLSGLLPYILGLLLVIGIGDTLIFGIQYWGPGRIVDSPTSGVWTALAVDFSQGHLYRPIISEIGYGGTRYMPLYFMYEGTLMRLGLGPTVAVVAAMQSTVIAMVIGIYAVLRRMNVARTWAVSLALVTFCTTIYQQYVTDTNCDYLAAALSLFALALYLSPDGEVAGTKRLLLVAFLSSLAFFTKFTTLYVPAAVLLHLMLTRQWRNAGLFAGVGIAMVVILFGVFQTWSGGLMLESIASSVTGRTEFQYALGFLKRFALELFYYNPAIGVTFLMAIPVWIVSLRVKEYQPVALTFIMITLATMLIFISRGIAGNHVIAFHAFSLVMIGAGLTDARLRGVLAFGIGVMALIVVAAWLPGVPSPRKTINFPGRETVEDLKMAISKYRLDKRPILTDQASIPALFGERSFVLDNNNLSGFYLSNPVIAEDFRERLARKDFSIVVVENTILDTAVGLESENYVEATKVGRFRLMVPRP